MKSLIVGVIWFIASSWCFSQEVLILDEERNPIANVAAFNIIKTKSSLSDNSGIINLSRFVKSDTLFFQHPSYKLKKIKKSDIVTFVSLERDYNLLEDIQLIETKNENNIKNVAEKKIYISSQDIASLGGVTTPDLLEKKGGVTVQRSQMGGGSPNIRGFEANKVLLVLDGVRLNNAIYRSGHLQNLVTVDEYILDDIEIVFGPSSVLYGSDALGGTVNMRSKDVYFKSNPTWSSGFSSSYGSAYSGIKTNFFTSFESKKYSTITSVSLKTFGDLKMGSWRPHGYKEWGLVHHYIDEGGNLMCNTNPEIQKSVGYQQYDFFNKSIFKLSSNWRLTSNIQYSTSSNVPRFDRLNDGDAACMMDSTTNTCSSAEELKFHSYYYGPQERFFGSIKLTGLDYYFDKSEIIIGHQFIRESRHKWKLEDFMDYLDNPNEPDNYNHQSDKYETVKVYSLNSNFRKGAFYFGSETIYNDISSKGHTNTSDAWAIGDTRYPPDGSKFFSNALYVNVFQRFSHKLQFEAGIRYTFSYIQGAYPDTMSRPIASVQGLNLSSNNHILSGNFKFIYYPSDSWKISSVTSRGFHTPNIDDMLKVFEKGGNLTLPNIYLEPEYALSQEVSVSKNINENLTLYTVGFFTRMTNAIVKDSMSINMNPDPEGEPMFGDMLFYENELVHIVANQNDKNPINIYGLTIGFNALMRGFEINGDFNITAGTRQMNNNSDLGPLAHIPPNFGKIEIIKNFKDWKFRLFCLYAGAKSADEFDNAGVDNLNETAIVGFENNSIQEGEPIWSGSPSWHTLNASINYTLNKKFFFQISVENLLDAHYKTFGSGISAAGRNFIFSTNILF